MATTRNTFQPSTQDGSDTASRGSSWVDLSSTGGHQSSANLVSNANICKDQGDRPSQNDWLGWLKQEEDKASTNWRTAYELKERSDRILSNTDGALRSTNTLQKCIENAIQEGSTKQLSDALELINTQRNALKDVAKESEAMKEMSEYMNYNDYKAYCLGDARKYDISTGQASFDEMKLYYEKFGDDKAGDNLSIYMQRNRIIPRWRRHLDG
ncbi:hypothetical protein L204_101224 [Cryptococcus depauperatus]|nr:hypothetical protein L204_00846 [Cryptococcus depauperatus CBS 7855]